MNKYLLNCKDCNIKFGSISPLTRKCTKCIKDSQKIHREYTFYGFRKARKEYLAQNENVCSCCKRVTTTVHHKDGNKKNNLLENFMILCRQCHTSLHRKFKDEFIQTSNPEILFPEVEYGLHGVRLLYQ